MLQTSLALLGRANVPSRCRNAVQGAALRSNSHWRTLPLSTQPTRKKQRRHGQIDLHQKAGNVAPNRWGPGKILCWLSILADKWSPELCDRSQDGCQDAWNCSFVLESINLNKMSHDPLENIGPIGKAPITFKPRGRSNSSQ